MCDSSGSSCNVSVHSGGLHKKQKDKVWTAKWKSVSSDLMRVRVFNAALAAFANSSAYQNARLLIEAPTSVNESSHFAELKWVQIMRQLRNGSCRKSVNKVSGGKLVIIIEK
jgi:hypothetical protein